MCACVRVCFMCVVHVCVNGKERQNDLYLRLTELCICGLFVMVVLVCLVSNLGADNAMSLTQISFLPITLHTVIV